MSVTLSTIAKKVGLTKTTVSRVLNGKPGYSQETRKRVHEAAAALGFRHNPISRALAGAGSMTLGFVINTLDPLVASMLQTFEAAAGKAGYRTIVLGAGHADPEQDTRALLDLIDRKVDGFVIDNYYPIPAKTRALLDDSGLPVIYVRFAPPGARRYITVDREPGLGALAKQLASWGHKQGVFVHSGAKEPITRLYHAAFLKHFEKAGVRLDNSPRYSVRNSDSDTAKFAISADSVGQVYSMVRHIARSGKVPGLMVFPDDEWAMAGIAALMDAGLSVPRDVSVTGHDDHPLASVFRPGLSTVSEPCGKVGELAFELISGVLKDPTIEGKLRVESRVVLRGSAGPAAK